MDEPTIMQRIKNVIVLTLLALWPKVPVQASGFELLGFDIMVDSVSRCVHVRMYVYKCLYKHHVSNCWGIRFRIVGVWHYGRLGTR
jgi:hypothetical protein